MVQVQKNIQTREWSLASAITGTQGGKLAGICSGMSSGTVRSEEFRLIGTKQTNVSMGIHFQRKNT